MIASKRLSDYWHAQTSLHNIPFRLGEVENEINGKVQAPYVYLMPTTNTYAETSRVPGVTGYRQCLLAFRLAPILLSASDWPC